MSIKIITDSAADYEQQELIDKDIICVPLSITWEDKTYLDGIDLSKHDFYQKLLSKNSFPMTSQPSPDAFLQHFKAAKDQGDTVVAILLASALSGTYQSANIAWDMAEYDQIYLVDSSTAASSLRMLTDVAVSLRDQGLDGATIAREIEGLKSRTRLYAMLDTLEYLHQGGRLTRTQAAIGGLTRLKPIITINPDGSIAVAEKCLGKGRAYKNCSPLPMIWILILTIRYILYTRMKKITAKNSFPCLNQHTISSILLICIILVRQSARMSVLEPLACAAL